MENKIAKNKITLQTEIFEWSYEKAIERLKPLVKRWSGLTIEIARELFIAHKFLTNQKGQYQDPNADDFIEYTWKDFCEEIELPVSTAKSWLRFFIPAEESETGEDTLLTPQEYKALMSKEMEAELNKQEKRIAKFLKTGIPPKGWTHADEREVQRRKAEERAKKIADLWSDRTTKIDIKPRRDFFEEILQIDEMPKNLKLPSNEQNILQQQTFVSIDDYFKSFHSMNERLIAAKNLMEKMKLVINYYSELDLQDLENLKGSN